MKQVVTPLTFQTSNLTQSVGTSIRTPAEKLSFVTTTGKQTCPHIRRLVGEHVQMRAADTMSTSPICRHFQGIAGELVQMRLHGGAVIFPIGRQLRFKRKAMSLAVEDLM